jgi:hypothetical protein
MDMQGTPSSYNYPQIPYNFLGSVNAASPDNATWNHLIQTRHRGGASDGNNYALQITSDLINTANAYLYVRKTAGGDAGWTAWRALAFNDTLASYAPLASPAFTGTPAAPTAAAGTNNTQLATTAFVKAALAAGQGGIVAQSLGASGYIRFGNGLTFQWIQGANGAFTWPIAFSALYIAGVGSNGGYNHCLNNGSQTVTGGNAAYGVDDVFAIGLIN